jgi:hypothetical protein
VLVREGERDVERVSVESGVRDLDSDGSGEPDLESERLIVAVMSALMDRVFPDLVSVNRSVKVLETERSGVSDKVSVPNELVRVSSAVMEIVLVGNVLVGVGGGVKESVFDQVGSGEPDSVREYVPEGFLKTRASVKVELT